MLKTPREEIDRLADAMREVKDRVTYCSTCSNITDVDPCFFCTNPSRDGRVICVVEEPENVAAVEKTRDFKGKYHVLMGALSPLQGVGPADQKVRELLLRVAAAYDEKLGQSEKAVEYFRRAQAIEPDDPTALQALEKLYTRHQRWPELLEN